MAMMDYGALVKKNGKLITNPKGGLFQNYSTLSYGTTVEIKDKTGEVIGWDQEGDESKRFVDMYEGEPKLRSVIGNHMAVIGDEDYLFGFYKDFWGFFNHQKEINGGYVSRDGHVVYKVKLPCCDVALKWWDPKYKTRIGTARFIYKGDIYEVLFGYGIDPNPKFLFGKGIERYLGKKLAQKVRRWVRR